MTKIDNLLALTAKMVFFVESIDCTVRIMYCKRSFVFPFFLCFSYILAEGFFLVGWESRGRSCS